MAGRLEGKVAFITGAARGQGRCHAIRMAEEGADIIAVDICDQVRSVPYPMATAADLDETVKEVKDLNRQIIAVQADVRDYEKLKAALDGGVAQLGRLDIVCANAGITSFGRGADLADATWQDMIDTNLTGVWHTAKAAIPHLIAGQRGGSIILTSSSFGLVGVPNLAHYVSAKHGVVGLARALALELAPHYIRVNSVAPTTVNSPMVQNESSMRLVLPDEDLTIEKYAAKMRPLNALPIPWIEPRDVSNAMVFLASDESRYITGIALPIDAGSTIK